ncbi:MAG: putative ATPase [Planctomycetota bacterium]|jgi:predicted ATPase
MQKIKLSNFRKIKDSWDLDLAPITFFTGTNNSGKSTVIKSLLLLEDYVKSNNQFELIFYANNARKHKIDCFSNAINKSNRANFDLDSYFEYSQKDCNIKLVFQPGEIKDKIISKGKLEYLEIFNTKNNSNLIIERTGGADYMLKIDLDFLNIESVKDNNNENLQDLSLILTYENTIKSDLDELTILKSERLELINSLKKEIDENLQNKTIRISRILRELNISLDRAITYLHERNFNTEARPTAIITPLEQQALIEGFSTDKSKVASMRDVSRERANLKINLNIKQIDRKIIELNFEITNNKKKLKDLKRIHQKKSTLKKDRTILMPEFSLSDFDEDLGIDNVIRTVLPKYLMDEQKRYGKSDETTEVKKAYEFADKIKEIMSFSVEHLSPQRNSQTRLYINNNTSSDMNEIIREHSLKPLSKNSLAGKFLKKWMITFDIGSDFKIKQIEGLATQIELTYNGELTNLADKGFGAGQVFAILLKIALIINKYGSIKERSLILLIEEPEANLHPKLQSKLAELFLDANKEFGINFILETHSEYMIRMSQIIVKQINEKEENTKIPFEAYYFDKEDKPYSMIYRKDGKFTNEFGSGFFDVSSNLAFDIL